MTIGERIRAERESQGISRQELARAGGIAVTTLSDLELGGSKSTTALHKIAARLSVSADWLETGRGPKAAADRSQLVGIDVEKLAGLIEALESAMQQSGRPLAPRTKAKVIATLYVKDQAQAASSPESVKALLASLLDVLE